MKQVLLPNHTYHINDKRVREVQVDIITFTERKDYEKALDGLQYSKYPHRKVRTVVPIKNGEFNVSIAKDKRILCFANIEIISNYHNASVFKTVTAKKYQCINVGIFGVNIHTGLGTKTKLYNSILSAVIPISNVYIKEVFESRNVNYVPIINKWIKINKISHLIFFEPVTEETWKILKAIRKKHDSIKLYAVPTLDITRTHEIENYKLFDKVLCETKTTFDILANYNLTNLCYVGWYQDCNGTINHASHSKPIVINKNERTTIFFHNAGWGGDKWRKNTEACVLAFDKAVKYANDIKLHIHTQRRWDEYPTKIQQIAKNNPHIYITEGDKPYNEIMEMTANCCDMTLLPSRWEGLGIPFYESLVAGKPVITVDAPPMNEIIKHCYNGFLCKCTFSQISNNPDSPLSASEVDLEDMAKRIVQYSRMSDTYKERLSKNARATIRKNYTKQYFKSRLTDALGLSKLKVLFIADYYYPFKGGAERSIHDILEVLSKNSCECSGLCFMDADGKPFTNTTTINVDDIHIVQSNRNSMQSIINDISPDLVITQLNRANNVAEVCIKRGIPYILCIRSFFEHICATDMCKENLLNCRYMCNNARAKIDKNKSLFNNAIKIISNSNFSKDVIKRVFGVDSNVIYPMLPDSPDNGIEIQKSESPEYKQTLSNSKRILFFKLVRSKGAETFIRIAKAMDNINFMVVGDAESKYIKIINEMPNIEYVAPIYNAWNAFKSIYSDACMAIVPSIVQEGFGRIPIEAMACGVPVIASKNSGLIEAVGDAGILIDDYKNADEWIKAIETLLNSDSLRNEYIKKGYEHTKKFTRHSQEDELSKIIKESVCSGSK